MRLQASAPSARPLVVRCGAFGDMVLITALIHDLSVRFRSAVDVLTSGPWSEPLLRCQDGVGEVVSIRSRKMPYWLSFDQRRAQRWLRARGLGPTWYCDGNDAAYALLLRAGLGAESIVDSRDHALRAGEHATEHWRRLARVLPAAGVATRLVDLEPGGGGAHLDVTGQQAHDLKIWWRKRRLPDAPCVAVQVGNKRTMRRGLRRLAENTKYWPNERWAEVLAHVRARLPSHVIVMLGTGREHRLNEEIISLSSKDGIYNVADDLPVPRLIALLSRVQGLITVDSGPAHAAAAVGCPLVVLFGKASTTLYRPWGTSEPDVRVLTGCIDGELNMQGISAAQVVAAWESLRLRTA